MVAGPQPASGLANHFFNRAPGSSLQRTFPNRQYPPPIRCQGFHGFSVFFPVPCDFSPPEISPRSRPFEQVAIVAMPETSMDKNDCAKTGKNHVRLARQFWIMKPIAEPECMKHTPDRHFGPRILAPDTSHHTASSGLVDNISQRGVVFVGAMHCTRPLQRQSRAKCAAQPLPRKALPPHCRTACRPAYRKPE